MAAKSKHLACTPEPRAARSRLGRWRTVLWKKKESGRQAEKASRSALLSDDGFPREAWAGYWLAGDKSLRPHHSEQGMPSRRILFGAERIIDDGSHTHAQCCGPLLEPTEAIAWQQSIFENTKDDWYSRSLLWICN